MEHHSKRLCKLKGPKKPPQNSILFKQDINNILLYSAKKKTANINPEYSTLYPATNSASASGKSKGVRFVSAKQPTKNIICKGSNIQINNNCRCAQIISYKFNDPDIKTIGSIAKLKKTS